MYLDMKTANEIENKFTLADYAVFAGMLLVSIAIGIYYAWKDRHNTSNKEFLTANRSLSVFPVAMSLLASFQSSVTILGYPAEMFYRGTQFWMVIISGCIASIVAAELFLPIYYKLQFTSVNKYLKERFNSDKVRLAVSFSFLMCTVPYMGVVLYGPSLALGSVTPISVNTSVWLLGMVCTLYTSIGGIKAVVWTDAVQIFLMFGGLIAVMIRGFYLVGGIENAFQIANEKGRVEFFNLQIDPYSTSTLWNAVIGMAIMWTGNYCTSQTEVQRYCNVASQAKAKLALYINMIGMVLLISCACLCGVALFAYYSECDPLALKVIQKTDQLMPYFVMDQLSFMPGLPGLFVACVFSASLSTLSSGFNALATVTFDDFLTRLNCVKLMSESSQKRLCKLMAFSYGLMAIGMAFLVARLPSVLSAAISIAGALIGPMLGLFLLGVLFPFANTIGVLSGLFAGEAFGIWVLIGSLIYPKSPSSLPTSIRDCPASLLHLTRNNLTTPIMISHKEMETTGILQLYHIAFLLVPVSGFIISLTIGTIVSLISGGFEKPPCLNTDLMSPLVWKIWPKTCLPTKQVENRNFESKSGGNSLIVRDCKNGKSNGNANSSRVCVNESDRMRPFDTVNDQNHDAQVVTKL